MRLLKLGLYVLFFSCLLLVLGPSVSAQENAAPSSRASTPTKKSPVAKQLPPTSQSSDVESQSSLGSSPEVRDDADVIRKRAEWFYKQRSSANGHIPAGARLKAFQHMQRMMVAEGKLVLRPDGSYAEVAPQSSASPLSPVTSTWTSIGPTPTTGGFFSPVTGRITTIAVDPSDATGNTVLIGGAMGGIWRTTDGGTTWTAVGDQNASLAMGSIAFAPSSPSTVYAATGESESVAYDIYYGAGVLKSTDGGQTWTQTCKSPGPSCPFIGPYNNITPFGYFTLGGTRITYIAVNPTNPQMILVAAQTQFAQGTTEGVYCSDNGGTTWSNILADQLSSFVGFASPTVAYAALGNPFGRQQLPNGNGIYKATSIGSLCSTIHLNLVNGSGLPPQSSMGRIDIGIAPSDASGNTVYASIADASIDPLTGFLRASRPNLGVFKTINGGTSWTQTTAPDICHFQCWYDNVVKVDPNNSSIAFFGGGAVRDSSGNPSWVVRTEDGGTTWSSVIPSLPPSSSGVPHVDNHAMAFFKATSGAFAGKVRMYLGNDGGIWRTDDAETSTISWANLNNHSLTLTQFYPSISIHATAPSMAFGGTQDNGSQNYQGPSVSWTDNQLCGDGASTATDTVVPSTVYIGCATGAPINASYQNGAIGTFFPAVNGINLNDFANFIPPLASDPSSANTVYFGTTKVYQSTDAGNTWLPISNDLVGGPDSLVALAVAPTNPSVVYVGANVGANNGVLTGLVFVSTNVAPGNFTNFFQVTGQGSLPPRALTAIAVDPADATGKTAYVTFSGFSFVVNTPTFSVNDPTGHIFKTTDGGATWKDVSCSVAVCTTPAASDLPNTPVNDLVVDPDLANIIYAATDEGVFVGDCTAAPCNWSTLSTGLPHVVVLSLRLHEPSRTLRAASHGRGAWDINLNNFSFTGPHISSISPPSVNAGTSTALTLTVNGSGLTNGSVQWNGSASNVTTTQVSDTKLTASIAASLLATAGTPKITVVVGTQASNVMTFAVLASIPTITSITPSSTPVQSNPTTPMPIQLTGTNFAASARVLFNGAQNGITVAAPTAGCPLPTCLAATLPAALLGPFGSTNDIAVLNLPPGGGQSKPFAFKVAAPPPPNDNFANAIAINPFTFGDVQDSSGATTETADPTPPCAHQYTVAQGNTGGQPNGRYNTIWYQFAAPVSANLNVDTIGSSYDTVLSIWTGTQGNLTNVACNDDINPGIVIQSQLQNVPLTAGTTYYIMVSSFGPPDPNPIALGGDSLLHFSFNGGLTPAPTITSVSPTSASSGGTAFTLTVNGSNFINGAIVDFNNTATGFGTALTTTFVSSTQLTTTVPASTFALPGPYTVNVLNPLPTVGPSNFVSFTVNLGTYPVPTLSSISPTTAIAGSLPFQLIATGSNFAPGAILNFNGVAQTTSVAPSAQNAYATISTASISTPGTVQVTVSNPSPGGGSSAPQPFVITQPTVVPNIISLNPPTVPAGLPTALTINGTAFVQGAVVVSGSGFFPTTTFVSTTQLFVPNFEVDAVGNFPIYVVDPPPAGTSTAFNVPVTQPPPPAISSISPTSAPVNSSPTLTITGTNFQNGASIMLNNSNFPAVFTSPTLLTTTISLGGVAAGTYPLVVVNHIPSPTPSAPVNFTVTPPPDFSVTSSGTTTTTVNAGTNAMFTNAITVAALNGFNAQVDLSCTLPTTATATTCAVSPNTFAMGSGTASVTVTTTKRGLMPPSLPLGRLRFQPQWTPLFLVSVMLAILLLRFARTRRQRLAGALPFAVLALFLVLQAMGCGGGGYTSPPPPTGTPAGTYTVTVTGTSGNTTHTATLTLTVN